MKPIDFRNENFASIAERLTGQRERVLDAWRVHGPGTTADVAERAKFSILSFRPRTTELVALGLVMLDETQPTRTEARYRVRTAIEHAAWLTAEIQAAREPQQFLPLR